MFGTKQIVVVDLDGTLADHEHRLHFILGPKKDWDSYYEALDKDSLIESIADMVKALSDHYDIAIVTGRNEKYREPTEKWLDSMGVNVHFTLRMRPENDRRPDYKVKPELIEDIKGDVSLVIEDRERVVQEWRAKGYTCLQVKEGRY